MHGSEESVPVGLWRGLSSLDGVAAALSNLCVIHCLLLPLVLALLPLLSLGVADSAWHGPAIVHWILIGLAVPASAYALWRGSAVHGRWSPWVYAAAGFLLMGLGAFLHGALLAERLATLSGGLLLALAHWRNWAFRRC